MTLADGWPGRRQRFLAGVYKTGLMREPSESIPETQLPGMCHKCGREVPSVL